jgi:hypothetical protein
MTGMADEPNGIILTTVHDDLERLDELLGRALYSHLRGMGRITEFRRGAVQRAFAMYEEAGKTGADELQIGGFGLLVNQRTLLAVEDLGALIYALSGPSAERWTRFSSHNPSDLDTAFEEVVFKRIKVRQLFHLPSDDVIANAPNLSAVQQQAARHLRDITAEKLKAQLEYVAAYWIFRRESAKALAHGWTVVAAPHIFDPPGAGELAEQIPADTPRPFVVALVSTEDRPKKIVQTKPYLIDLRHEDVEAVRLTTEIACDLLDTLADTWLTAARSRSDFRLQTTYSQDLPPEERAVLEELKIDRG